MQTLANIADYVSEKINSRDITLEQYVTTDSLLQDKRGRERAQNLPPVSCNLTHFKKGDVLVANIRPYLKKIWYADTEGGCSSDVLAFRAKERSNSDFLYAILMADSFYSHAMVGAKGSKMPRGDKDQIMRYKLPILSNVKNIGKMIVDIDSIISLNRAINHNLEAMAKQLYDYWFVQFDFPNEEGKPYKSSGGKIVWNEKLKREIPEGWKLQSYGDLCHINKVTLSRKEDIQYIEYLDTSSLTKGVISATQELDRCKAPSRAQRKVEDLTILYSCVRPRLLHYGILCNPTKNLIASTGFATIDAIEKEHSFMLYMHLTTLDITEYLASIADTAVSSYPSINPSDIASLETLVPPKCIVRKFQERIEPMFRLKEKIRLENTNLTKQRDELLPLLMNGQVSVNYDLSHD